MADEARREVRKSVAADRPPTDRFLKRLGTIPRKRFFEKTTFRGTTSPRIYSFRMFVTVVAQVSILSGTTKIENQKD